MSKQSASDMYEADAARRHARETAESKIQDRHIGTPLSMANEWGQVITEPPRRLRYADYASLSMRLLIEKKVCDAYQLPNDDRRIGQGRHAHSGGIGFLEPGAEIKLMEFSAAALGL